MPGQGIMPMPMQPGMQMGQPGMPLGQMGMAGGQMAMNLCQDHFPEPIMMFRDKPLCKKCISEQFAEGMGKQAGKGNSNPALNTAKLPGAPTPNEY